MSPTNCTVTGGKSQPENQPNAGEKQENANALPRKTPRRSASSAAIAPPETAAVTPEARTFDAFPTNAERSQNLTFSHHSLGSEPLPSSELPSKAGKPIHQRSQRAAAADPGRSAAVGQGVTRESGSARDCAVSGPSKEEHPEAEDGKERRGKRYTTFQAVRKGLAQVANELALGKTDAKTAAVRVQALQAIANVLAQQEQIKIDAEIAALEKTMRGSDA